MLLHFHRFLVRQLRWILVCAAVVLTASVWCIKDLPIDMSFRPLFAHNASLQASTQAFDAVFGQSTQRWIGLLIECNPCLSKDALKKIHTLSDALQTLPHVSNVISPTHFPYPPWASDHNPVLDILHPSAPSTFKDLAQSVSKDPYLVKNVLSENQTYALVLADVDIPVEQLHERVKVLHAIQAKASSVMGNTVYHSVGSTVIEEAYSKAVLWGLAKTSASIACTLALFAWLIFGHLKSVLVVLSGVSLATPVTLAVMRWTGQPITAINSLIPNMAMIIGISDAIHLMCAYNNYRKEGFDKATSNMKMFQELFAPCLMTALTTALGFISLGSAQLTCIRNFGIGVSYAVCIVFVCNIVLVPVLIGLLNPSITYDDKRSLNKFLDASLQSLTKKVLGFPLRTLVLMTSFMVVCAFFLPRLNVVQHMNNELSQKHEARKSSVLLEQNFIGIYGPSVSIKQKKGDTLLDIASLEKIASFVHAIETLPDIQRVDSFFAALPPNTPYEISGALVSLARNDAEQGKLLQSYVNKEGAWASLYPRTGDIGTARAMVLGKRILEESSKHLGNGYEVSLQGQWWMAQHGLNYLLHDMLSSFGWACFTVLPLMAFMLRKKTLILASVLPNLLPSFFALCFMSVTGISMRVGTAMVVAIALGVSVDSTIHLLERIRFELSSGHQGKKAIEEALRHAGRPIAYSSFILTIGFLSMCFSDLKAIYDMGIVGSATLLMALVCDLTLTPSVFLLLQRNKK